MSTFETSNGGADAFSFEKFKKSAILSSLADCENMPDPTPEELAEADRIIADLFEPYEQKALELRERQIREAELSEHIAPHLVDLTKPAPVVNPIIEHEGMMIASLGNISAIVGAAKSKKTFLCTALVGGLLSPRGDFGVTPRLARVLWIDTEQSSLHARKVVERIHRLAGFNEERNSGLLHSLTLREVEPKARAEIAAMAIELYKPHLVVIDGISDLMYNTNDIEESDRVVGRLMALSTDYNCHILCVLHTNPNSDKARGHIGSTLLRKAESVVFVHKVGDCSVVEPQYCRNEEFAPFAFRIDAEGLPVITELPSESSDERNDCVEIMRNHYPNGIERAVLIERLQNELGLSHGAAKARVIRALQRNRLRLDDGVVRLVE